MLNVGKAILELEQYLTIKLKKKKKKKNPKTNQVLLADAKFQMTLHNMSWNALSISWGVNVVKASQEMLLYPAGFICFSM